VLDLNGHTLKVEYPRVEELTPAANVTSRLVTIKGAPDLENFRTSIYRQLDDLEISARPTIDANQSQDGPKRRVLRIKDRAIVGFSLSIYGLSPEESLRLQESGLGGRRRMGCGIFVPLPARLQNGGSHLQQSGVPDA
jgi:CRISPR-associated protein Cas6